jgi:hypothetical protein
MDHPHAKLAHHGVEMTLPSSMSDVELGKLPKCDACHYSPPPLRQRATHIYRIGAFLGGWDLMVAG